MRFGRDLEAGHDECPILESVHSGRKTSIEGWAARGCDVVVALLLAIALSPLIASALAFSALSFRAMPVVWRERDGTRDARVRVYGIRTEKLPRKADGRAIPLRNRQTQLSWLLRSTRLDRSLELVSIFRGDLSLFR